KGPSGPFTTCQLSPPSVVASQKREPAWEVNIRVPRSASTNTHCPGKPGWGRPAAASRRHERPPSVVRHSATGAGVRGGAVGGGRPPPAPAGAHRMGGTPAPGSRGGPPAPRGGGPPSPRAGGVGAPPPAPVSPTTARRSRNPPSPNRFRSPPPPRHVLPP